MTKSGTNSVEMMLNFGFFWGTISDLRCTNFEVGVGNGGAKQPTRPALEKSRFCSSGGGRSKKLFEPRDRKGRSPVQKRKASFFCAAGTWKQKRRIFRQPWLFWLLFWSSKKVTERYKPLIIHKMRSMMLNFWCWILDKYSPQRHKEPLRFTEALCDFVNLRGLVVNSSNLE